MNPVPKAFDPDETPEYPLPSPTDSLSRNQRPPDEDTAGEQLPSDDAKRGDIEAVPDDQDIADPDAADEPS